MWRIVFMCLILLVETFSASDKLVGNIVAQILSTEDEFIFVLSPSNVKCDSFMLAFKSFAITGSAQLQIYDKGIPSPFFTCVACGSIIPPVFYSSTGSVTVKINGVGGAGFNPSSFELQYVGQIADPNNQYITKSHTNFNLFLRMPYGHIRPVLMGGQYLAGSSEQIWMISLNAPTIKFFLGFLNFEADINGNCGARLFIYDGLTTSSNILFSGCTIQSDPQKFLYSSSGDALVVLKSLTTSTVEADFLLDYLADDE